jgi:hypothetical protein
VVFAGLSFAGPYTPQLANAANLSFRQNSDPVVLSSVVDVGGTSTASADVKELPFAADAFADGTSTADWQADPTHYFIAKGLSDVVGDGAAVTASTWGVIGTSQSDAYSINIDPKPANYSAASKSSAAVIGSSLVSGVATSSGRATLTGVSPPVSGWTVEVSGKSSANATGSKYTKKPTSSTTSSTSKKSANLGVRNLQVGDAIITLPQSLSFTQTYEEFGNDARSRTLWGNTQVQCSWTKLRTQISGEGALSPGLSAIPLTDPQMIQCASPRGVGSLYPNIPLPTYARTDPGYEASALALSKGIWRPVGVNVTNDVAEVEAPAGAEAFLVEYYPAFMAFITSLREDYDRTASIFRWSLEAEEV